MQINPEIESKSIKNTHAYMTLIIELSAATQSYETSSKVILHS